MFLRGCVCCVLDGNIFFCVVVCVLYVCVVCVCCVCVCCVCCVCVCCVCVLYVCVVCVCCVCALYVCVVSLIFIYVHVWLCRLMFVYVPVSIDIIHVVLCCVLLQVRKRYTDSVGRTTVRYTTVS